MELFDRAKGLRQPDRVIAETFVVEGTLVLKEMFIPDNRPRWRVEVKSLRAQEFRSMHSILLAYFNFAFASSHEVALDDIPRLVANVSDDFIHGNQCFRELRDYQEANPSEVLRLLPLGEITWRHLSSVAIPERSIDATEQVTFATMLAKHYLNRVVRPRPAAR